ncbi:MAG: ABC transporter ATP-binding protein, partial [Candidatus Tectomicrobia bacterium]|nr:ABC transporter ATP-binding protein [Candidatus Tectomicrobia bacterium]
MVTCSPTKPSLFRRLLHQMWPYWPHLTAIFVLDLLVTPLALLGPVPLKIAVDTIIGAQPLPALLSPLLPDPAAHSNMLLLGMATGLLVLVVLLNQLQGLGSHVLRTFTGERLTLEFRALLFHDARGTADTIYRIQYDAPAVQWLTLHGILPIISSLLTLGAMLYVTACFNWQLALVAMSVFPFLAIIPKVYDSRMRGRYTSMKELESSTLSIVQEVLSALRVVKAFGR